MSLRRKLMMVLLLTSVLPMLAVRLVQAVSIFRLQEKVASDMRERLTLGAERDMLRTVDGYASTLDQQRSFGFSLLRIQAGAIEHRLAGPPPKRSAPVPTVDEFARYISQPNRRRWQLLQSEDHAVINQAGEVEPITISYDTQVVLPIEARQADANAEDDLAKLSGMTSVYKEVHGRGGEVILWHYTTLESGLHFSYPAKPKFPDGYSPQKRGWYLRAAMDKRPIGTRPYVDVSTQQLVITFAEPVMGKGRPDRPDRPLAGVTAIDLRVSRLLDPKALNTDWAEEAQVKIIAAYPELEPASALDGDQLAALTEDSSSRLFNNRKIRPQDLADPDDGAKPKPNRKPGKPRDGDTHSHDAVDPLPDTSYKPDVYIVADINQRREDVRLPTSLKTLAFDDEVARKEVTADLLAAKSGVRRVSIDGEDRMIAYGQVGGEQGRPVFALIVVPTKTIFSPVEAEIADVQAELRASLVTTGLILLVILFAVGGIAFFLSFRLTRPIVEMAEASRKVAGGDLDARVAVNRKDELGQLGKAFNDMVPALRDRLKIRESLAVAMQVQQSLLPNNPPDVAGLDIAGHSEYCDETGGDYYDFIEIDQLAPGTLAIAVGDVTGHGIAAALLMATGRALIRSYADTDGSLGDVFTAVNRQLCDGEFTGRFMTLMYLVINNTPDANGNVPVRYLSAGHDPVIVYRPSEDTFLELDGNDIPLGIDADWAFVERSSDVLRPGDVLVVGTDGIWECFDAKDEQFGKDRLNETIRAAADGGKGTADDVANAISTACRDWRGDREQEDDITMVVVKLTV